MGARKTDRLEAEQCCGNSPEYQNGQKYPNAVKAETNVESKLSQVVEKMERETRIELATNSLEGCDSTIELLPHASTDLFVF